MSDAAGDTAERGADWRTVGAATLEAYGRHLGAAKRAR